MKNFIVLLALILSVNSVFAFDIVYPKKNEVTINAKSTFFIGSSDKPLKINGKDVILHPSGGFAHVVNLNEGLNTFILQTEDERKIFVIKKPVIKSICNLPVTFTPYKDKVFYYVTTDGAPLRSTPVDAGINRIAHLPRNTNLIINGEKSGFYRVELDKDKFAWISKSNVKKFEDCKVCQANLLGSEYFEEKDFYTYIFHLNHRVPFEIVEGNPMQVKLYNIEGTYTMELPYNKLYGYSGEYRDNDFIVKVRKQPQKTLKNMTIAIDAGHGGLEFGAIGCLGHKEKDINLSIAKYLEAELKKRGAKVVMTRVDDVYTGLKERVQIANLKNAAVLLSIHANALPDGSNPNKISGTSVYYYYNQAKGLADTVLDTMVKELNTNNDKVHQASLALVRNTNALSILIETAYMINPEDNARLINPEFQKQCARAIADGLEKYFQQ